MASAGTKRPHSESTTASPSHPLKRRRVVRKGPRHLQPRPDHVEVASQDPAYPQGQLLRSITAALTLVGFDSVQPTALEMFRAATEEYVHTFACSIKTSMAASRRTHPTPTDFTSALALMPATRSASQLAPQLKLSRSIPSAISAPAITPPVNAPPPAPDFTTLLQPLVLHPPTYVPTHFPQLPPSHSWRQTPVFPEREQDPRRMRERATEEGLLAEQALRTLAAAKKTGAIRAEKRKEGGGGAARKKLLGARGRSKAKAVSGEGVFADMLRLAGGGDGEEPDEVVVDGGETKHGDGVDVGMPEGVVVNWDMQGWRSGGGRGVRV